MTTDDAILAGFAAQPENKGKFKVVGKPFSTENYGIGLKKGDTAPCQKINDAIKKMVRATARSQKAIDNNLGPAGYKPGPRQPADPGRLLLTNPAGSPGRARRPPGDRHDPVAVPRITCGKGASCSTSSRSTTIFGAFWMTI